MSNRDDAIRLLLQKQADLHAAGLDRMPQRSDFSQEELVCIKAHLGALPRALEAAGLKAASPERESKRLQKRIAAKRRKTTQKIIREKEKTNHENP